MCQETVKQPLKQEGRRQVTQVKTDKIKAHFQCRHLRQGRSLRVLQYPWNYLRTTWLDSRDSPYRNCKCDKFPNPQSFLVWKFRFRTQVTTFSDLPSRSVSGKNFPNFEMLDAKIASALNKIIQNSQFKKKVSLEEQKAQKEDRCLRGRQIAFMIYDYFRVTGAHDTVLDYADLFSVALHDDNIQEFDTRWDKFLLSMSKISSDDILESLYKSRIRESAQLKNPY